MKKNKKAESSWMAIYTKARSEKKTAERLKKNGIKVYCPTHIILKQWSDRRKKVEMPVFPSYIFVKVTEQERYIVLQDPAVLNFVFWLGQPAIIKEEEIDNLQCFLEGVEVEEEIEIATWKPGDQIKVAKGPFKGLKAKVKEANHKLVSVVMESIGAVVKLKAHDVDDK